ncbi:hypothetical protein COCHEDRAFT_1219010 [Bipolaris maydis C5]|uniref:Uncharacterized protein n=1 Tax=Cochliobolus heterostrophus (strain C5 / ATCC 48332 / race O) TaxID=701091 RepID=M2UCM8_COCH5|nr:hypothetical protein COCHEDRAFT_1219010 [Bipolaris maydis C5]
MRPIIQSSPQDGRIGQISPHKIARIYAKDPQRDATTKDDPLLAIPAEYRTQEFKELFEENEATDLAEHQD